MKHQNSSHIFTIMILQHFMLREALRIELVRSAFKKEKRMIMIAGVISMIKIKNEDVEFLKKYIFDNDTEKLDKLLNSKNINDLLIELNDWLAFEGFDKNYNLNKVGLRVQEIYDYIYAYNCS